MMGNYKVNTTSTFQFQFFCCFYVLVSLLLFLLIVSVYFAYPIVFFVCVFFGFYIFFVCRLCCEFSTNNALKGVMPVGMRKALRKNLLCRDNV